MAGIYYKEQATENFGYWQGINTRDNDPRPIRIRPNQSSSAGTIDDYFCYYTLWQFQEDDEGDGQNITIPQFEGGSNNFQLSRTEGDSQNPSCDIVIIRKSDRKAVRITGNMLAVGTLTYTDVSDFANYPELQRLRLLGII